MVTDATPVAKFDVISTVPQFAANRRANGARADCLARRTAARRIVGVNVFRASGSSPQRR